MNTKGDEVVIPMRVNATELWRAIFGGGWDTCPWWTLQDFEGDADWDKPGVVRLGIENPNGGPDIEKRINMQALVEAVSRCANNHYVAQSLSNDLDFDAISSDVVLQTAVLGELVYG